VSLLFVPGDDALQSRLGPTLATCDADVETCHEEEDLVARLDKELPEALVVDVANLGRRGVRLIRRVQAAHPAADVPIVAITGPSGADARADRALEDLGIYRRFSLDLPDARLRTIIDNAVADAHRYIEDQPDRYAVDVLARVWGLELTGLLRLDDGREAPVVAGGTVSGDGTELVHEALDQGGLFFEPCEREGLSDAFSVGLALWDAALALASDDFLKRMGPRSLSRLPRYERAFLLPLDDEVARLVDGATSPMPLERRLKLAGLSGEDSSDQLEALFLLGMVQFKKLKVRKGTAKPANSQPQQTASVISGAPTQAGTAAAGVGDMARLHREMVAKRLRQDVERLEKADDWTVLAISPCYERERIQEAGDRMHSRYSKMAKESTIPELKSLAQKMTARVERAVHNLERMAEIVESYGDDCVGDEREEAAFQAGYLAMAKKEWPLAVRCFTAARDLSMHSPRNLAYLGWSLANDVRLPEGQRLEEATEMLRISESLAPKASTTQFFIASIEAQMGYFDDAEQRLSGVIKSGKASVEARNLFMSVKQKKSGRG